jgi:hypothetical protein
MFILVIIYKNINNKLVLEYFIYIKSIHESLLKKPENFRSIIESYAFQLTHIPIPPVTCQRFSLVIV